MSSVATNKKELIDAILSTYKKLRPEFDTIPPELVNEMSMEGQIKDTKMTVHNLLSYLVGWGDLMLKWDQVYTTEHRIPDLPDTGYSMNDWGKLADRFYKEYEKEPYGDLLKKFDEVVEKIVTMLERTSDTDLYGTDWYVTKSSSKGYSFGRMVALNTSSPYKNARDRIRKWKKGKGLVE